MMCHSNCTRQGAFQANGNFYKGNLHCHSSISDGKLTIQELKAAYRSHGYDFLVYTDHNIYGLHRELDEPDFITIQGFEGHLQSQGDIREFHFVMIPSAGALENPDTLFEALEKIPVRTFENLQTAQSYIDDMTAYGYMVMLAHPRWSTIEYDDILPLGGLFALEVYNSCSNVHVNLGDSTGIWDAVLRRGKRLWGTAVDDNHNFHQITTQYCDSFGGWVCVKALSLTEKDICRALEKGNFYASQGPEIHDFYIEDGHAYVTCSPVSRISLIGPLRKNINILAPSGEDCLTSCCRQLRDQEEYIRLECEDHLGRKAYSNPIFF